MSGGLSHSCHSQAVFRPPFGDFCLTIRVDIALGGSGVISMTSLNPLRELFSNAHVF